MTTPRSALVLGLMLTGTLGACGGGSSGPDAGPPAGWTCDPAAYGDGNVCHCECGIPDPDCAPGVIVTGCVNDQICAADGTCTYCGNGAVNDGEACDSALADTAECAPLGYEPGQVPCNATCEWAYDQCTPLETCNNGMLDPGELCDGASIDPGLDCTEYGHTTGTLACLAGCAIDASGCYTCGDGAIDGPEGCDDFDTSAGDGCSGTCTVESGWQCTGAPSACTPVCGDGMQIGGEGCDDGNPNPNDGCSATCQVEQDCTCSGSPSQCSCATLQVITTTGVYVYLDTAALALDAAGQPRVTYYYGIDYTDPVTSYLMEHGHLMYAVRPATSWQTSEITTWNQVRTTVGPDEHVLAYDGGSLRQFFHRIYDSVGTFGVATRDASTWQLTYDNPYYVYQVVRGGSDWHALVAESFSGDLRYYMGAPGAWTRNEPLPTFSGSSPYLGYATTGDVYIASYTTGTNHTSYNTKLSKRVDATTWSTVYDVATTGTCVYPVMNEPLALPGGEMIVFEEGFSTTSHWLRAHRKQGAAWVTENVADLSYLSSNCTSGGVYYTAVQFAAATDQLGRPHILFAAPPENDSTMLQDHYRDGTGWHVRTFPLTQGRLLDVVFDANGTAHILAGSPGTTANTTRLVYIRIDDSAW